MPVKRKMKVWRRRKYNEEAAIIVSKRNHLPAEGGNIGAFSTLHADARRKAACRCGTAWKASSWAREARNKSHQIAAAACQSACCIKRKWLRLRGAACVWRKEVKMSKDNSMYVWRAAVWRSAGIIVVCRKLSASEICAALLKMRLSNRKERRHRNGSVGRQHAAVNRLENVNVKRRCGRGGLGRRGDECESAQHKARRALWAL